MNPIQPVQLLFFIYKARLYCPGFIFAAKPAIFSFVVLIATPPAGSFMIGHGFNDPKANKRRAEDHDQHHRQQTRFLLLPSLVTIEAKKKDKNYAE
jgi:hypothetical protein